MRLAGVSFYGPCSTWRAGHLDQVNLLVLTRIKGLFLGHLITGWMFINCSNHRDLQVHLRNREYSNKCTTKELNKVDKNDAQSHILGSALMDICTPDSPVWIADITLHTAWWILHNFVHKARHPFTIRNLSLLQHHICKPNNWKSHEFKLSRQLYTFTCPLNGWIDNSDHK